MVPVEPNISWAYKRFTPAQRPQSYIRNNKICPYLLRNLDVNRANHVWASDISYIPMTVSFLYLRLIMAWYSRKVLRWRVSNSLDVSFCMDALGETMCLLNAFGAA